MSVNNFESQNKYVWQEKLSINKVKIAFKLDTGSQCNVTSLNYIKLLNVKER